MNHDVEAELRRQCELMAKQNCLAFFVRLNLGGIFRQVMIIEFRSRERDDARTLRQGAELLDRVIGCLVHLAGMNADGAPDIREILGQLQRARTRIDPRADGNELRHARRRRARNHLARSGSKSLKSRWAWVSMSMGAPI